MSKEDIRTLVSSIQKDFGSGSLMLLGDEPDIIENQRDRMSSGLYELNWQMAGGLVRGGMMEIFGPEAGGKTTLALTILARLQQYGCQCHIIDAEHKLNLDYAQRLGVNTDDLLVTQPSYGEHGLDIMQAVAMTGLVDVIVVDSVTALVPKADIDGDFTDANMGAHARMMSKMCRVVTPITSQNNIIFIVINQVRQKIGVFFGSPETTTGGNAIKFYAGMRFRVSSSQVKTGGEVSQSKRMLNIQCVKHQWDGQPYTKTEYMLNLGIGIDKGYDMLQYGLRKGIIEQKSSSFNMGGKHLGNGKQNAGQALLVPDMVEKYKEALDAQLQPAGDGKED